MASYTDAIAQFNPYVQQLPVELMAKVGMQKQAQYDAGIQKVQSYIDNVAGLDIAHESDKEYLQSKLGELGNKLKTVAAGDFSNQQLVNSVGGMATQLMKDADIQNAVSSTAMYKKGLADIEAAKKAGKYSAANEYNFMNKANGWLASKEKGQKFGARYTPYTEDPQKKALEAIKALHPNLQNVDIPYVIKNGQIDQNALASVMKEHNVKEITEDQITMAIKSVLNENDYNQLAIDGEYRFRGIDSSKLQELASADYLAGKKSAVDEIYKLQELKKTSIGDPTKVEQIDKRIEYYQKQLGDPYEGIKGDLDKTYESAMASAKDNPDAVKGLIYKDAFIKQFANAFKWKEEEWNVVDSPYEKVRQWKEDNKLDWAKYNQAESHFNQQIAIDREKLQIEKMKEAREQAEAYGTGTQWTPLGNDTSLERDAGKIYNNIVANEVGELDGTFKRIMAAGPGDGFTESQVNKYISLWKKNADPKQIDPAVLGLVKQYAKQENYVQGLTEKRNSLEKKAVAKIINDPANADIKQLQSSVVQIPRLEYDNKQGRMIVKNTPMTGEQLLQGVQSGKIIINEDRGAGGRIRLKYTLPNGQQGEYETMKYGAAFGGDAVRNQIKTLAKYQQTFKTQVGEEVSKKLAPAVSEYIPRIKALPRSKDGGLPSIIKSNLTNLLVSADYQSIAADSKFDQALSSDMLSEKKEKDTEVSIHNYDGNKYEVWMTNKADPKNIQKLKLTEGQIQRTFGDDYLNKFSKEKSRLDIGKGNTNLTANPERAILQKQFGDFPNVTKLNIRADLQEDAANPGEFIPMVVLNRKNNKPIVFPITGKNGTQRVGYEQGLTQLNALNDNSLMAILKESYPNFDFSTLEIR